MRVASKIAVGAAAAAALIGMGLGPALADPPTGVTPKQTDVVGVGSNTTALVMDAIATAYDATNPPDKLYSWDAVNPVTGATGQTIITKGPIPSPCGIARPYGSNAGVTALATTKIDDITNKIDDMGNPCIDYARSSSGPSAISPSGLVWVGYGKDAVTWVTTSGATNATNATNATGAPATLTAAQLNKIYSANTGHCLTWKDVGGISTATIVPALPQSSGDLAQFLSAIGEPTIGSCVVNGSIDVPGDPMNPVPLEDNTSVSAKNSAGQYYTGNAYFFAHNPNALYPYSVADWIAQQPKPAGGGHATSIFGSTGVTEPREISGISPVTVGSPDTISTAFVSGTATKGFTNVVYNVVPNVGTTTAPKIASGSITTMFGPTGVVCSDTTIIRSYGFLTLGSLCGFLTAG
jgi:ABC-type phosphate transport system substrate-binding protein